MPDNATADFYNKVERKSHRSYTKYQEPPDEAQDKKEHFWAIFNSKAKEDLFYICGSFTHWMPVALKKEGAEPTDRTKDSKRADESGIASARAGHLGLALEKSKFSAPPADSVSNADRDNLIGKLDIKSSDRLTIEPQAESVSPLKMSKIGSVINKKVLKT